MSNFDFVIQHHLITAIMFTAIMFSVQQQYHHSLEMKELLYY